MRKFSQKIALPALAALALLHPAAAQTVVNSTFLGGNSLYSNPENWSPPEVPNNTATKKYNVTAMERFFLDRDATISNLTMGDWALFSSNYSLTVTGATTIDRTPGSNITGVVGLMASNVPITVALGSLSTFANGGLTGGYFLTGPATLQFNGADVTRLSGASVTLGSASRIVNENGLDGLRNLARVDADSFLGMTGRQGATAGSFTMEGRLSVQAEGNVPGVFLITGSLTNFDPASRTLDHGTYELNGGSATATLKFPGADVVNNRATLFLYNSAVIVDELGRDALRNFSHNLTTGQVRLVNRDLAISGDFTNDGLLDARDCSIAISGALRNFDPATKRLNGGVYRLAGTAQKPARLSFAGADIVHNNAALLLGFSAFTGTSNAQITDENGNDALRNLIDNQGDGVLDLNAPFTAMSDFTNAGVVTLGFRASFMVPAGYVFQQSAGSLTLNGARFTGDIDLSGGELISTAIPPSFRTPFPGATPTMAGNLVVGGSTLRPKQLGLNGNVHLSSGSTWHYVAETPNFVNAGLNSSGRVALDGRLEVEYPSRFPPGSLASFYIATAGQFTGAFSNAANGTRITTTDGAGSFALIFTGDHQMFLTHYQRAGPAAQLLNISTRARVLTGDDVAIGGFVIYGRDPKKVVLRAMGPSLTGAGVSGALQDPTLALHDSRGAVIATNDNWQQSQSTEITETGLAPEDTRESAIVMTLQPGAYTAVMRGANNTTGVALVEIYDLSKDAQSKLANISTRGFVDRDNVLIGGFIAGGNGPANAELVIRALGGFSLEENGVANPLDDPALAVRDGNGALVAANDDFTTPPENYNTVPMELYVRYHELAATGVNLPPGHYTVVVYGKNGASGNALVEIYDLNR